MVKRIGILTSGGDCPGLNAAIRGVAKAAYGLIKDVEIVGIFDGYRGLIENDMRLYSQSDFSGILTLGGTILGTSRQPFKQMKKIGDDNINKPEEMVKNYKKNELDCLVVLGGNGTHKTANMLSELGLNVIGLPKTIDNDIYGTDITFGFQSAVNIATDVIDRMHSTATSHNRVMVVELMGHKAGWLTLYAGVAGGADVILLPEIPYDINIVAGDIKKRADAGKPFSIMAVAEGAISKEEAAMTKKELKNYRKNQGGGFISVPLAEKLGEITGMTTRASIPGHYQRGGSPCPYDRTLSTRLGAYAAQLIKKEAFGLTVAVNGNKIVANKLSDVAGKLKLLPVDHELIKVARDIGTSFGDK